MLGMVGLHDAPGSLRAMLPVMVHPVFSKNFPSKIRPFKIASRCGSIESMSCGAKPNNWFAGIEKTSERGQL